MSRRRAARVAGAYALVATVWIAFSDGALAFLGLPAELVSRYSFLKGIGFVVVTTAALYVLVDRFAKESKRREDQYRELFELNPNPMWFYDTETLRFLRVNEAAVRKYGYSREQFLTMRISDIRPVTDIPRLMRNVESVRSGETGDVDQAGVWQHKTKDGRRLWVDITSHLTEVGGRPAEVVLVRDVTEAHEAEQALLRHQQDLESLVSQRTAQLERANAELKAATEAKSVFLATMSHELRTPLNSILGFANTLADGMAGPLNDEQRVHLGHLRDSARHLHSLVDDVLDLSRIESGRVEVNLETVTVADVAGMLDGNVRALAAAKGLAWDIGPLPDLEMVTDPRKLMQILLNLLGNAVKYTASGSVRLDVEAAEREIRFLVTDTGPGIAESARHRLFEEFVRLEADCQASEGSGLGLAIAARYARLLGGSVELTHSSSSGSTFAVTLPVLPDA